MISRNSFESRYDFRDSYDAVIVGARVAGAATAMLLSRAGMRVLVLEKSAPASDTLSTLAMMRAGVMQLNRWGVLDRIQAAGTPPVRRTTFHYGAEAIPVDIKERDGVDALYAPRRTVLDTVLVAAAREAGAHVAFNATVTGLVSEVSGRVCGVNVIDSDGASHRVSAGIVIGADGAHSSVAREVRARVLREGRTPAATIYGYWHGLDVDGYHWLFAQDVSAGLIPTNDDLALVFVSMRPERYQASRSGRFENVFAEVLSEIDLELAASVFDADRVGKFYPFPGRPGFIRESWGPGWALVGDAACFKDPSTAHGITDALRDAESLANAVITGSDSALDDYLGERDEFAAEFLELSDELASFDWDTDQLKALHIRLSKLMNRECDFVRSFHPLPEVLCA